MHFGGPRHIELDNKLTVNNWSARFEGLILMLKLVMLIGEESVECETFSKFFSSSRKGVDYFTY